MNKSHLRRSLAAVTVTAAATVLALCVPASAGPTTDHDPGQAAASVYVVRIKDVPDSKDKVAAMARSMVAADGGTLRRVYYSAIQAFSVTLSPGNIDRYYRDSRVSSVTANKTYHVAGTQSSPPSWGLDRIDQRDLPLDDAYHYPDAASGVHAYVVDSGVRTSHREFGGRAHGVYDAIRQAPGGGSDCNGHGTQVAATIAGRNYGVAKQAQIESVKAFDCAGTGTMEQIMSAVDWVDAHAQAPAIVNLSFSGPAGSVLDYALYDMTQHGIAYTAAAGNGSVYKDDGKAVNACNTTPARQTTAITVSATNRKDTRPGWANYGQCVHLFAPGTDIVTASNETDRAGTIVSGTSIATAEVTGVAAMYLARHPETTPEELDTAVTSRASSGKVGDPGKQSPNLLVYAG